MGLEIGFFRVVDVAGLKIEVSIVEHAGYKVYLTAKDNEDRRLWHTALTDAEGKIKVYTSISDSITAAESIIEHSKGKHSLALSA